MKSLLNEVRRFQKIAGLTEDLDLSDTPEFQDDFRLLFYPYLKLYGVEDDEFYSVVHMGYMGESVLAAKVKGKDICRVYEKAVDDNGFDVQDLQDIVEGVFPDEEFPEACVRDGIEGIVSLVISEDDVLDIRPVSLNEIKRFQKLAGVVNEMHVDASGNLISDEEFVRQIVWKHSTSLAKALSALHKGLGDERKRKRAKDFIKQWLINVAEEIGLDPVPSFDDPMFYQGRNPGEILNYVRDTLTSMLEQQSSDGDEGELTEDDYTVPDNARSGDTAIMGNISEDELDLSDTPRFRTQYPRDFHKDPDFRHWIFDKSSGWECNQVLRLFHLMRRRLKEERFVNLFISLQSPETLKYWWDYYTQETDQSDGEFHDFEADLMPLSEDGLDLVLR